MLQQAVDRHLVSLDDSEHAIGDAGFLQQLGDERRRRFAEMKRR